MNSGWKEQIERVKRELRDESVEGLAHFDVKDGEENGEVCHKTYLDVTRARMGELLIQGEWSELTPWQKLCCYRVSGNKGMDCDAALYSTVIYQLAFGDGGPSNIVPDGEKYLLNAGGRILRGDTMNSYATTIRKYIRGIWFPAHKSEMLDRGIITETGEGAGWAVSETYWRMGKENCWDAAILAQYDYFENILPPAAQEFFRLCHTVGNFIPAPPKFQDRGGGPSRDYWDLALMCIYHDYHKTSGVKYTLEWLVGAGENTRLCRSWLDSFGQGQTGWDSFVERNFLQEFVNQDGGHYGLPRELWKGHFAGMAEPKRKTDFEQFFTNASAWISARGIRVALAVKAALEAEGAADQAAEAGERL